MKCIVPVETGYFSLHGLAKMMETLEVLREKCGKEILIRVLPTLYDTRTKLAREVLCELRGQIQRISHGKHGQLQHQAEGSRQLWPADYRIRSRQPGLQGFCESGPRTDGPSPGGNGATPNERLTRPQELVQRAKQLAQLTNFQFGRTTVTTNASQGTAAVAAPRHRPPRCWMGLANAR